MINFEILNPNANLGDLPGFLREDDPRPAREQIHAIYKTYTSRGWSSFPGFTLLPDDSICYPGDPPLKPLARGKLRDETILVYPTDWVCIIQPDRSYDIARIT